jgi:hypothetical protein
MKTSFSLFSLLFLASFTLVAQGQQVDRDSPFYPSEITFDPDIPRPESVIGHPLGHRIARNDLLVQYMRRLAELSPRISVEEIAYTHEGRPILGLTITSPANHARIDEIRAAHVALSDPQSNQEVSEDMPIVTWLNYGGNVAEQRHPADCRL